MLPNYYYNSKRVVHRLIWVSSNVRFNQKFHFSRLILISQLHTTLALVSCRRYVSELLCTASMSVRAKSSAATSWRLSKRYRWLVLKRPFRKFSLQHNKLLVLFQSFYNFIKQLSIYFLNVWYLHVLIVY